MAFSLYSVFLSVFSRGFASWTNIYVWTLFSFEWSNLLNSKRLKFRVDSNLALMNNWLILGSLYFCLYWRTSLSFQASLRRGLREFSQTFVNFKFYHRCPVFHALFNSCNWCESIIWNDRHLNRFTYWTKSIHVLK